MRWLCSDEGRDAIWFIWYFTVASSIVAVGIVNAVNFFRRDPPSRSY